VLAASRNENRELTVVGRVVLPGLGNYPGGDKTSPGDGALVTAGALRALAPAFTFSRNVVRLENGADVTAVREQVSEHIGAGPDDFRVRGVQRPADIVDLDRVRSTPLILAAMLGLLGAATIAHALVTTIRRRRRDLAMLKTLGFTRRQVSSAIAWQASTIAVLAVVIGVPLGVALGRAAWSLLATSIGVLSEPAVAWLAVALALPILLVGANIVAAVPAWLAGRTKPAAVLRSE
jgi:predicted lysophospholipase L1 biosynthesis ABC-type transport system permease subunit